MAKQKCLDRTKLKEHTTRKTTIMSISKEVLQVEGKGQGMKL